MSERSGSTADLTPDPESMKKKSKAPLIVGAGVVAIAIVVGVAFYVSGSGHDATVDVAGAHAGLGTVIDSTAFDENGNADVSDCPLGDINDLTAKVTKAIALDNAVAHGTNQSAITAETDNRPATVSCQYHAGTDNGASSVFFQGVYEPPQDYQRYIEDFVSGVTNLEFGTPVSHENGTIYPFCGTATEDAGFTGCDADWVDKDHKIALNVFLGGDDVDPNSAITALKSVLDSMAKGLAAQNAQS